MDEKKGMRMVKGVWPFVLFAWMVSPPSFKERVEEIHQTVFDSAVEGIYMAVTPHVSPVYLDQEPAFTVYYPRYELPLTEAVLPSSSSTSTLGSNASVFVTGGIDDLFV